MLEFFFRKVAIVFQFFGLFYFYLEVALQLNILNDRNVETTMKK